MAKKAKNKAKVKIKMKTRRAVAERFSLTGTGKVKHRKKNLRHCLEQKSKQQKKRAAKTAYLDGQVAKNVKEMIPYK